jgi:hypothetical protein
MARSGREFRDRDRDRKFKRRQKWINREQSFLLRRQQEQQPVQRQRFYAA